MLTKHLEKDHAVRCTAACTLCDNIFLNKLELERHIEATHKDPNTALCATCSMTYPSKEALKQHIQLEHELDYVSDVNYEANGHIAVNAPGDLSTFSDFDQLDGNTTSPLMILSQVSV